MTVSPCPTVTVYAAPLPSVLTAETVTISAPTCAEPCGVNVMVTWRNVGIVNLTDQIVGITVDGITPTGGIVTGVDILTGATVTYNFTVTGLTVTGSPYTICPVPN